MNDPNKVINVNLSSLLSLKAELLRKQAEVNKAKSAQYTAPAKEQEYVSITSHKQLDNTGGDADTSHRKKDKKQRAKEIEKIENATVYEHEDSLLLQKSQKVLEAKAKFYERMSKSGGQLNVDDNCLVMFNKKKQDEKSENPQLHKYDSSESDSSIDEYDSSDHAEDPDDDWVEYTDCLGRTRKCLKRDYKSAKKRDAALAASMPERLDQTKANWMIDTVGSKVHNEDGTVIGPLPPSSVFGDGLSIMSKHEEQKANWERKEQENMEKTDVHYQDVFFDEARQHGVGYYAFSTDEKERKKQQKELEKERQKTLQEQERREALKAQREKIIAERVLAAKNRQRGRLGLPPLEIENNKIESAEEEKLTETKEEKKARKKASKLERKRQREEQEKEKERQNHVRPWDEDKEGIQRKNNTDENKDEFVDEWQYKKEREPMSQEQWNEMKRKERNAEFAPPTENPLKRTNFRSSYLVSQETVTCATAAETFDDPSMFCGFQSSLKKDNTFKRKNYESPAAGDSNFDDSSSTKGVCIPPPSNLEDFKLPSHNKKAKTAYEVEKSIEAGLRFIRNNCDKVMPATKQSWTAKADY